MCPFLEPSKIDNTGQDPVDAQSTIETYVGEYISGSTSITVSGLQMKFGSATVFVTTTNGNEETVVSGLV